MDKEDGENDIILELLKDAQSKIQDQDQTIRLLQVEVSFQKERIDKQELMIKELTEKVEELCTKSKLSEKSSKEDPTASGNVWNTSELSIADAVKETAESALMAASGFVFDPQTKLYCNYSTGYYYDPGQGLYYNGHTGTYYTYNADKQKYLFHSQVDLSLQNPDKKSKKKERRRGEILILSKTKASKSKSTPADETEKRTKNSNVKDDDPASVEKVEISLLRIDSPPCITVSDDDDQSPIELTKHSKRTNSKKHQNQQISNAQEMPDKEKEVKADMEIEEGEVSSSGESDVEEYNSKESATGESDESDCDEEEPLPNCIRAIVLESNSCDIKNGSLFIITYPGGTIGSKGNEHTLILPGPDIEKVHAKIEYMLESESKYCILDHGGKSGTILNGLQLEPNIHYQIAHGSVLKIGGYSILLHIHPGNFTCGHCEPGLTMENYSSSTIPTAENLPVNAGKSKNAILRQIKKKYGINPFADPNQQLPDAKSYKDRATQRRLTKGSDNPFEKTQVATMDESIGETNKGFKMLSKMGWSAGSTLGNTTNPGLLEPIKVEVRTARQGLGLSPTASVGLPQGKVTGKGKKSLAQTFSKTGQRESREDRLAKTVKRFKEASSVDSPLVVANQHEVKMETDIKEEPL